MLVPTKKVAMSTLIVIMKVCKLIDIYDAQTKR